MIEIASRLQAFIVAHKDSERGATMVEYGLMLALIAVICLAAIKLIGTNANDMFTNIANSL